MNLASRGVCIRWTADARAVLSCTVGWNIYRAVIHMHIKRYEGDGGVSASQEQKPCYFEKYWRDRDHQKRIAS